ncbi:hypothetical protein [Streptomyces subrutilus]|uniref:hypothetical protein n=1 Tax=Streptomyces subrutilus TaxID=36818 RepID=UPI0034067C98
MPEADGTTATAPASRPYTAWPLENILFSAALVARRMPWADLPARTLGLDALTREGLTRRLVTHLRGGRDGRPVRLRTPFGAFLVPLTRAHAEDLLARADRAGALGAASGLADDGRRYALSPHAAPAGAWDEPAQDELDGLTAQVSEQLVQVLAARREDGALDQDRWHAGMLRLSRYVVLGAGAAEDTLLSELVSSAGPADGRTYEASRAAAVRRRLEPYVTHPEPGSLADRLTAAGGSGPETLLAVAHALALVSTATSTSALQALALLAAGAGAGAADGVTGFEEAPDAVGLALDRYPPLSAVVHPVRAPFEADGAALGAGEDILYLPALWGERGEGERAEASWALCANLSGCSVARFAALVCRAVVRGITAEARPVLLAPRFTADRLPDTLDPRTVAVALTAADGPGAAPDGHGAPLSGYGVRGHVGADRLERHADTLAACAADSGWDGSEAGERFRMILLAHADRCARAAADVRGAARRLSG